MCGIIVLRGKVEKNYNFGVALLQKYNFLQLSSISQGRNNNKNENCFSKSKSQKSY